METTNLTLQRQVSSMVKLFVIVLYRHLGKVLFYISHVYLVLIERKHNETKRKPGVKCPFILGTNR